MLSNDKAMLRQFIMGEDIHMIRAMKMVGTTDPKDVSKEQRKKAKAVNFGYVYGMGAPKFVTYAFDNYDVKVTLEEAHKDRDQFFDRLLQVYDPGIGANATWLVVTTGSSPPSVAFGICLISSQRTKTSEQRQNGRPSTPRSSP
jgi:hypothetical protein